MMKFRLRVKRTLAKRFYGVNSSREKAEYALQAYKEFRSGNEPAGVVPLLGEYLHLYEKKFGFKWVGTSKLLTEELDILSSVYEAYGDVSFDILCALMLSKQVRWVTTAHTKFLSNRDNITKFIIPILAQKRHGEQSEFTKKRTERKSRKVQL